MKFKRPTEEAYEELQAAYDYYNDHLFEALLPPCLITFQREKRSMGYFSKSRFIRRDGVQTDEIAMNPDFFAVVPLVEILQTLVHEMAHLWQAHFGTPSRACYHNREWALKMERIGLMPSDTGQPTLACCRSCSPTPFAWASPTSRRTRSGFATKTPLHASTSTTS